MIWASLGRMAGAGLLLAFGALSVLAPSAVATRQAGTPTPAFSCDAATPAAATPAMDHDSMASMDAGTPMADMAAEFDQLYINMMIPHHASIIAMAQAALPRLEDERLREIAQTIIDVQTDEQQELRGYREQFYGSAEPMPMDATMMGLMMQTMPGMGDMAAMAIQMDPVAQVAAFCAEVDPELAFIDQTIAHHEMAITASEAALEQATHPEIIAFAQRVIEDQQREIDELTAIRAERGTPATPPGSPGAVSQGGRINDQVSLEAALRAQGLSVEVVGPLQQPFLQPQSGAILRLAGGSLKASAEIQVYQYADAAAAEADAAQLGPDGNPRTAIIEWVAPPHFFRSDRVIVLYVGSDPAVLDTLTQLLGPQFAGQ